MKVSGFCTTTRTTFCFYGHLRRGFYGVLRRLSTVYYVEFSQTKILLRTSEIFVLNFGFKKRTYYNFRNDTKGFKMYIKNLITILIKIG